MYNTNNLLNKTICAEAQRQIDRHYSAVVPKIIEHCAAAALPEEVTQAIIDDFNDILQDSYNGLHLSIEGIQLLAEKTTPQQWKKLQSPALNELLCEYDSIGALQTADVRELLNDTERLDATLQEHADYIIAIHEAALQKNASYISLYNNAVNFRHAFAIMQYVRSFHLPPELLHGILPVYLMEPREGEELLKNFILKHEDELLQFILKNTGDTVEPVAGIEPEASAEPTLWLPEEIAESDAEIVAEYEEGSKEEKYISQFSNITEMLKKPLQVQNINSDEPLQPLYEIIKQQEKEAEQAVKYLKELQENPNTTEEELQRAQNKAEKAKKFIASKTYIYAAFKSLIVLADKYTPVSAAGDYFIFPTMPVNELIRLGIGETYNPDGTLQGLSKNQKEGMLYAFDLISMWRCSIYEYIEKQKFYKDKEDGKTKTKWVPMKKESRINPAVINVYNEKGEDTKQPVSATTATPHLNRIFVTGLRRESRYYKDEEDGSKVKVVVPHKDIFTYAQFYEFRTKAEVQFLNLIKNVQTHYDEDRLLSILFDYDSQVKIVQKEYEKAKAALQAEDERQKIHGITEDKRKDSAEIKRLTEEVKEAQRKIKKVTDSIRKHRRDRDIPQLLQLFLKASKCHLVKEYWRTPPPEVKHNKQRPVWEWTKYETEEPKQHRTHKKK